MAILTLMTLVVHLVVMIGTIDLLLVRRKVRQPHHHPQEVTASYTFILAALSVTLVYDNAIILLGSFLGEGEILKALNLPRFWAHALITPLLVVYTFGLASQWQLPWATASSHNHQLVLVITVLFISGNLFLGDDLTGHGLVARQEEDILRYVVEPAAPPIPTILTNMAMIVMGAMVWQQTPCQWILLGSLLMFAAAVVGVHRDSVVFVNIGEAVMMCTLWAAEVQLNSRVVTGEIHHANEHQAKRMSNCVAATHTVPHTNLISEDVHVYHYGHCQ